MKFVLFCSFLAFCAFETAFSDAAADRRLSNQLYNMKFASMQQINDITNPILQRIQRDVDAAKTNGKNAQPCYETARIEMKSYVDPGFSNLERCRVDALAAKSIPYASSCNSEVVSTFRQNANTVSAQSCLTNL
ncbi:uncharacterized protein LOC117175105 [Belonocnema kinseyi]|uniref:uncharacterized protein LOC117175105 n=1 Tax=Belonocnema kinseyi TaxID=2817044 RepID=UPI00143D96A9|nr:uncharacterized protein LOC117175105 [Belonocnema kinseyi]